jgi:hypothetical protein
MAAVTRDSDSGNQQRQIEANSNVSLILYGGFSFSVDRNDVPIWRV